jgi:protein Mpv17
MFSFVLPLPLQMITLPPEESLDLTRTLRMASYGMLLSGPSLHFWFNFLSKAVPKKDLLNTFKKMFLGQAVYGPIINCVFFSYNAGLQGIILICFSVNILL